MIFKLQDVLGKTFIYYYFLLYSVTILGFILGFSISVFNIIISLILLFTLLMFLYKDEFFTIKVLSLFLFLIFISIVISSQLWDFSYDGRWYHFNAIYAFDNGWNPIYNIKPKTLPKHLNDVWIESYPKLNWILIANHLHLFKNIEFAKFINIGFLISTALVLNTFLKKYLQIRWLRIISVFVVIFNPVSIAQIGSLYLDGNLYYLVILLLVGISNYYTSKNIDNIFFIIAVSILLINIKFTGLVYVSILFFLFIIITFFKDKKVNFIDIKIGMIIYLLGIFIYGFAPYVNNMLNHSHPLYPIMGSKKINVEGSNLNKNFLEYNRFKAFFYTINSAPTNSIVDIPELENPFLILSDLKNYSKNYYDLRYGGFGPIYSLVLFISILLLLYYVYRKNKINNLILLGFAISIISFSIPLTSWVRLIPMMWAAPLFTLIGVYNMKSYLVKAISIFGILLLLINAVLFNSYFSANIYKMSKKAIQKFDKINDENIKISFTKPYSEYLMLPIIYKFKSNHINYLIVEKDSCIQKSEFYGVTICQENKE